MAGEKHHNITDCSELMSHVSMLDFILLQIVMFVLMTTFMIYPLPRRGYTLQEYLGLALEFLNAFDIMDMTGDIAFARKYGGVWRATFFISLGISSLSLAFPIKIESDDFIWPQKIVVCATINEVERRNDIDCEEGKVDVDDVAHAYTNNLHVVDIELDTGTVMAAAKSKAARRSGSFIVPAVIEAHEVGDKNNHIDLNMHPVDNPKVKNSSSSPMPSRRPSFVTCHEIIKEPYKDKRLIGETRKKMFKIIVTLIFTDVMFAGLRFKIMVTEKSAEHGFNMFLKNVILACLHLFYFSKYLRNLFIHRQESSRS